MAGGAVRVKKGVGSRSRIPVREFDDYLCAARALVLLDVHRKRASGAEGKALWRLLRNTENKSVESKACRTLQRLTYDLAGEAQLDPQSPTDFAGLNRLQAVLSRRNERVCHIQVWNAGLQMALLYSTYPEGVVGDDFDRVLWYDLVFDEEHYYPVLKIHRVLNNQRKFCYKCKKTYQSTHRCVSSCAMCKGPTDHFALYKAGGDGGEWRFCQDCTRNFYGEECFNRHKAEGICEKYWKCTECSKVFETHPEDKPMTALRVNRDEHRCGELWCKNCKGWQAEEHKCYMRTMEPKEANEKFLFADFEATQETGTHRVNLAVTMDHTGAGWPIFRNMEQWLDHLLQGDYWGYTVIFHNGKGYDFHFVLKDILRRRGFRYQVDPVMVGAKILYFTLTQKRRFKQSTGIRFVDSLNFLPMALKKFTKTFGLTTKKGFYPHFFNTPEHESYIGPIPSEAAFGAPAMDDKTYLEFREWYDERKREPWDNFKELLDYCVADVALLREGCLAFRRLVMESTQSQHDPFQHITLASSAMGLFRTEMLVPETVAAFSSKLARELKPALAGGRTGATKLYYKAQANERIYYVDFTSAYPWVCKNGVYPKGHPEIWTPDSMDPRPSMSQGVSIWCVNVTCPEGLYHPLLHHKDPLSGLLLFDLRDKTEVMYTNLELLKAVELGYVITEVHKVYYWEETIQGVFKDYINIFLKMKQQAAGWPSEDMTAEEKQEYLDDYKRNEGIALDPEAIEKNTGKYHVAKLYLNSLWGKFGQRLGEHFTRTMIVHDTEAGVRNFNKAVAENELKDVLIVSDHSLVVTCDGARVPDHVTCGGTNIALAIFTTAHARLKLYNELIEPLGERIMYYDTDSAIFSCHDDHKEWLERAVPLGKYLGDVTNELGHNKYTYEGTYISEFVSGGPKNYGYVTTEDEKVSKIKGHSLKRRNVKQYLNFDAIKAAVLHSSEFIVDNPLINREDGFELVNQTGKKVYRFDFMKRRIPYPRGQFDRRGNLICIDTVPWCNDHAPPAGPTESLRTTHTILCPEPTGGEVPVHSTPAVIGRKRSRQAVSVGVFADHKQQHIHIGDQWPDHAVPDLFVTGFMNYAEASEYLASTTRYNDNAHFSALDNRMLKLLSPIHSEQWRGRAKHFVVCTTHIEFREIILSYVRDTRVVFTQG